MAGRRPRFRGALLAALLPLAVAGVSAAHHEAPATAPPRNFHAPQMPLPPAAVRRQVAPHRLFLQSPVDLQLVGEAAASGDAPWPDVLAWLNSDAEMALQSPIVGIWDEKTGPSPEAAWNDFVSLAPYWWPNPNTDSGLPYVRRDGYTNPEVNDYPDKGKLVTSVQDYVTYLAYAYLLSQHAPGSFSHGPDDYASRAVAQLRAWFVDFETAMTPNMRFAQVRPGRGASDDEGAVGILDLTRGVRLLDAIGILSSHPWLYDGELDAGVRKWFAAMLGWLQSSGAGKKAAAYDNNLGIYYDAFVGAAKLFLGQADAKRFIENRCTYRLDTQVDWDTGEMPAETARPDSMHYTVYALRALVNLAMLSDRVVTPREAQNGQSSFGKGVCWQHPNMRLAMAYLLPAALDNDPGSWPHELRGGRQFKPSAGFPVFVAGYLAWGNYPHRFGDAAGMWAAAGGTGDWGTRVWMPPAATRGVAAVRNVAVQAAAYAEKAHTRGEDRSAVFLTNADRDNGEVYGVVAAGAVEVPCPGSGEGRRCVRVETEDGTKTVVVNTQRTA